jgi:hypothetical protein
MAQRGLSATIRTVNGSLTLRVRPQCLGPANRNVATDDRIAHVHLRDQYRLRLLRESHRHLTQEVN